MTGKTIVQKTAELEAYLKVIKETNKELDVQAQLKNSMSATTQLGTVVESKPEPQPEPQPESSSISVRKNSSFGSKTWYGGVDWKQSDRSVKQFGFLMTNAKDWIVAKESNHVRVSKKEASVKIGEIIKARSL